MRFLMPLHLRLSRISSDKNTFWLTYSPSHLNRLSQLIQVFLQVFIVPLLIKNPNRLIICLKSFRIFVLSESYRIILRKGLFKRFRPFIMTLSKNNSPATKEYSNNCIVWTEELKEISSNCSKDNSKTCLKKQTAVQRNETIRKFKNRTHPNQSPNFPWFHFSPFQQPLSLSKLFWINKSSLWLHLNP